VKETTLESSLSSSFEVNVPARALQELARVAAHAGDDELSVSVRQNQVLFVIGRVVLSSRLIDGQFPNYKQLIPESFDHEVPLPRDEVLEVVRRIAVMAQRNSPLRLRFADGQLTVSARTQDVGEAEESLPVPFSGEPLEIGFNAEFLRDGIESVTGETIRFRLISPLRPCVLQADGADDYLYLIMPIRLAG
jgi:DNA polymerase-3 subunit beta